MKKFMLSMILLAALVAAVPTTTMAGSAEFRVTITNLTQDQSFTPILVASHKNGRAAPAATRLGAREST